jgi:precorrin-2 dehydrogenase/sirohydrochlorin ferrochelatase
MPYFPIFLDLSDHNVVVVGGGEVAERKVKSLLAYGCQIYVVAPHLGLHLRQLVAQEKIHHVSHEALDRLLDDAFIVIAATDDAKVNSQIASQAKERGILVNVVDKPEECTFIMPSIAKSGDLQIAISTTGKSPALAKKIRKQMDGIFGPEYGLLLGLLGLLRTQILAQGQASSKNKTIFRQLVDSNLLELIKKGNWEEVSATLTSILGEDFPVEDAVEQVSRSQELRGSGVTDQVSGEE